MEVLVKVEDLTRSLFREFLIKNNLTKTLELFNDEDRRFRPKITKIDLIRFLAIEKLIKMNKEKTTPRNSLLEIIVDYLHGKYLQRLESTGSLMTNNRSDSQTKIDIKKEPGPNLPKSVKDFSKGGEDRGEDLGYQNPKEYSELKLENSSKNDKKPDFVNKVSDFFSVEQNEKETETLKKEESLPQISSKPPKKLKKLANPSSSSEKSDKKTMNILEKSEKRPSFEKIPDSNAIEKTSLPKNDKNASNDKFKDSNFFEKTEKQGLNDKNLKDPIEKQPVFPNEKKSSVKQTEPAPKKEVKLFEESKAKEQKQLTDELDEFDDVFNFGVKQEESVKTVKKPAEKEKLKENVPPKEAVSQAQKPEIRVDLMKPFEVSPTCPKPDFDYFLKPKLGIKSQLRSKGLSPLDKETREGLRKLLFGMGDMKNFPKSWQQGFFFTENAGLFFGLMQKEGGPCGVLACVQAYLIKHLLFFANFFNRSDRNLLNLVRNNCLLLSLCEILWKCTSKHYKKVTLVLSESGSLSLESCGTVSYEPKDLNDLYMILQNHRDDFIGQYNNGVAFFLYSVMLTKGLEQFKSEMDISENNVIGLHSTCTQEVVNLMLTGEATSNCIDGVKEVDSNYRIRGVKERSELGFMTTLEFYNYTKVEQNFKEPLFPIWVLSTEYHYCVCFSNEFRALKENEMNFEIIFYDGLNHPNDFIVVEVGVMKEKAEKKKEENVPILEMVLSTKWRSREIFWKGFDPIF